MLELNVTIDTSKLETFLRSLEHVVEDESIPQVAKTHTRMITSLTAQGKDYRGQAFHPYNPHYAVYGREKQGFTKEPKDLRKHVGRLYDLNLVGNVLTVSTDAKTQAIALGQMTGASGRWAYSHEFLNVSDETNRLAAEELADYTRSRITSY